MKFMTDEQKNWLILQLQQQPFAIATDGSNSNDKMYPLIVTFLTVKILKLKMDCCLLQF